MKKQTKEACEMSMNKREKLNYIAENYMRLMWHRAYQVTSDRHEAEDACQEAFIKIIRMIDDIEDVTELRAKALCCIIAKNTAIDMMRKTGRLTPTEDIYLDLESKAEVRETPESLAESAEGIEDIRKALGELSETYREVIELRCFYEFSAEKAGEILGISPNSVNIRLSRARKALKEILERQKKGERTEAYQYDGK